MTLKNCKGLTLTESIMSIFLLSVLIVGLLGAFFISRMGTLHAIHRMKAINILKDYLEQEVMYGYSGGEDDEADYYETVVSSSPVNVVIDDRNTPDTSDDLTGTITADPYPAQQVVVGSGPSEVEYKINGFIVTWADDTPGPGTPPVCNERAVTYIANHGI